MKHTHARVSRSVALGAYVLAIALVLGPLVDLITTVLPVRLGDVTWRYGFVGLGAGYLHTPLLGVGLAMGVAIWQEDTRTLRTLGVLATIAAGVLIPVMGSWVLDVMEVRQLREPEARSGVLVGGVIQGAKYLAACVALALAGVGASRTARANRVGGRTGAATGAPGSLRGD